jgi:hypothetical protein
LVVTPLSTCSDVGVTSDSTTAVTATRVFCAIADDEME